MVCRCILLVVVLLCVACASAPPPAMPSASLEEVRASVECVGGGARHVITDLADGRRLVRCEVTRAGHLSATLVCLPQEPACMAAACTVEGGSPGPVLGIVSAFRSSGAVTVRLGGVHGLAVGQQVALLDAYGVSDDATLFPPGLKTSTSVPAADQFTYTEEGEDGNAAGSFSFRSVSSWRFAYDASARTSAVNGVAMPCRTVIP